MLQKPFWSLLAALMLTLSLATLNACEREGPVERAGENVDDAMDDAGDAIDDAVD